MIEELRKIRNRLEDAVNSQDWWIVKSQMNKIDTILYNDRKSEVKNLSLSDVSNCADLGNCVERNCTRKAVKDYNGHGHYVCDEHYESLSNYFDEEYK